MTGTMENIKNNKVIIIKIGTSSLTYSNGKINFQKIESLSKVLSQLQKENNVILVSSGAIAIGASSRKLEKVPEELSQKQALAAIGQNELMYIYDKFFTHQNQVIAQMLLTKEDFHELQRKENAEKTLAKLIEMNIIPIVNENDTISTREIEFGDNDTLSAYVAKLAKADILIILSDIDGLYSEDPRKNKQATILHEVNKITPEIESMAKGSSNGFAKGGMSTKIKAAKICINADITMFIANGNDPEILKNIMNGEKIGTKFCPPVFSELSIN